MIYLLDEEIFARTGRLTNKPYKKGAQVIRKNQAPRFRTVLIPTSGDF